MARFNYSAPRKPKTGKKGASGLWSTLFCKRSVIIISDRNTKHVPFAAGTQAVAAFAAIGFVAWAGFSSGSYVAAQKVIEEKERKLANFEVENQRVSNEFTLLKQDLQKLADGSAGGKGAAAAKQIVEQYADKPSEPAAEASSDVKSKYDAVFNRIQFLENQVKDIQSNHDAMMADIRATTGGKIKELERVIARTGVNKDELQRAADAKRTQDEQQREKYGRIEGTLPALPPAAVPETGGQGGPYVPVTTKGVLKQKDAALYFDLRKLMALNDIVTAMPLIVPMQQVTRQTSSFGTRVDPFRGTLSFHAGVDLAGPSGTKVLAANNGRIDFAGWKTAYGNVIDVKHELGFSTRYGHLRQILVRPGQVVKKGQVIAIQGSTGRSTGEHLHYEVQYRGKPINPASFLKAGSDVQAVN